jgi:hypothetical protein
MAIFAPPYLYVGAKAKRFNAYCDKYNKKAKMHGRYDRGLLRAA